MTLFQILKRVYKINYYNKLKKKGVAIGENCDINRHTVFGSEPYLISLGDYVRISDNVKFITHDGGIWVLRNLKKIPPCSDKIGRILIGNNVSIGMNVTILPNVKVGDNVVIGAGTVVTKNIPSNSIVAGVPGRVIESLEEYEKKVNEVLIETKGMDKKEKKKYLLSNISRKD